MASRPRRRTRSLNSARSSSGSVGRTARSSATTSARRSSATARAVNATQIVLGATRRSRWRELTQGSVINSVIRASGEDIDVHVISNPDERRRRSAPQAPQRPPAPPRGRGRWRRGRSPASVLTIVARRAARPRSASRASCCCTCSRSWSSPQSAASGRRSAAAVVAFLLANWYFTPPLYTFTIGETENLLALAVFLIVAGTVSGLVSLAARRAAEGQRARAEAETLARLAGTSSVAELLEAIRRMFGLDGVTLWHRTGDAGSPRAPRALAAERGADATVVVDADHELALRRPRRSPTRSGASSTPTSPSSPDRSTSRSSRRRRRRRASSNASTSCGSRSSRPSHTISERRLPGSRRRSTSLLDDEIDWSPADRDAFLATIDEETDRLDALVGNLLDMSRLQTGAAAGRRPSAIGLDEIVPAALRSLGSRADAVEVDVAESLPRVRRRSRAARAGRRQHRRERARATAPERRSGLSPAPSRTASTSGSSTAGPGIPRDRARPHVRPLPAAR